MIIEIPIKSQIKFCFQSKELIYTIILPKIDLHTSLRGILLGRGYGIKSLPKWLHTSNNSQIFPKLKVYYVTHNQGLQKC